MRKLKYFFASAAAASSIIVSGFALVGAASAGTTTCDSDATGTCNQQTDGNANVFDLRWGGVWSNNQIIAYPNVAGDKASDFKAIDPSSTNSSDTRYFEYSPGNVPSGYCISDTVGGVKFQLKDGLFLRPCNKSKYQLFDGVNTRNSANTTWQNEASGKFIQDNGKGANLSDWAGSNLVANSSQWAYTVTLPVAP
jgi:hypothetical protein